MALTGMTNEEKIWNYLKVQGFNDFGIAGLMGNLYAESGLKSTNLQNTYEKSLGFTDDSYTAAVDNGSYTNFVHDSAGYGLAQWTYYSRKQNLLNYAKSIGASIGDLEMQLQFLVKELNGYSGMSQNLKNATSVLNASNWVLLNFERPADQGTGVQNKRASFGQTYYDKFTNKSIDVSSVAKGSGTMKYSDNNLPLQCMMTNSTCYKSTRQMNVVGVLWHSTGANNPTLKRYVQPSENDANYAKLMALLGKNTGGNDWNHISVEAGLNCWIGKLADGTVTTVQTMPWNYRPWGCGSGSKGSCNNGWIQFEICEDGLNDATYFNAVYKEACEITAYLCKKFGIDPFGTVSYNGIQVPTILCHADSYRYGLGSNHGDVLHWFPKYGKSMETVRNDVAALMKGVTTAGTVQTQDKAVNYQGKVTANGGLNCRTSPIDGSVITAYENGAIITITKERNGWGYTGTGWVCLDYVQKISQTANAQPQTQKEDDDMLSYDDWKKYMEQYRKELQDNDCGSWSEEARQWAISTGMITGMGTGVDGKPNYAWADQLSREQAATLFYRFAQ